LTRGAPCTAHPSYLLRPPNAEGHARYQKLLRDLALAKEFFGAQLAASISQRHRRKNTPRPWDQ
jgi:hypothetical protein